MSIDYEPSEQTLLNQDQTLTKLDLNIDLSKLHNYNISRNLTETSQYSFQPRVIPKYLRYSQLKDYQGTGAVRQLSFRGSKMEESRQVVTALETETPKDFETPFYSRLGSQQQRISFFQNKFNTITNGRKQISKGLNIPKITIETLEQPQSVMDIPKITIDSLDIDQPQTAMEKRDNEPLTVDIQRQSPMGMILNKLEYPNSAASNSPQSSRILDEPTPMQPKVKFLGLGHFEKLLKSKGDEFNITEKDELSALLPKKKLTMADVLEGFKEKNKQQKNSKMHKLLFQSLAGQLDGYVQQQKEVEAKKVAERIPELIKKFQLQQKIQAMTLEGDKKQLEVLNQKFQNLLSLDSMEQMKKEKKKKDYSQKNKALMEMIENDKDKSFVNQIRYANPEVRNQINMLMAEPAEVVEDEDSPSVKSPDRNNVRFEDQAPPSEKQQDGDLSPLSALILAKKKKRAFLLQQQREIAQKRSQIKQKLGSTIGQAISNHNKPNAAERRNQFKNGMTRTKSYFTKEFGHKDKKMSKQMSMAKKDSNQSRGSAKSREMSRRKSYHEQKSLISGVLDTTDQQGQNFQDCESLDESDIDEFDLVRTNYGNRIFGEAGQKFREIIQKHFLSKTLQDLEKMDYSVITMGTFVMMARLQECIQDILTDRITLKRYTNIGDMYQKLDQNLYENKFLQLVLKDCPAFEKVINLKQKQRDKIEKEKKAEQMAILNQIEVDQLAKLKFLGKTENSGGSYTLNQLFHLQGEKARFFEGAKNRHCDSDPFDVNQLEQIAMKQYFDTCEHSQCVVLPHFVSFDENTLYLTQVKINHAHGLAIQQFFYNCRNIPSRRIYSLVIDDCSMKDEVFALLLDGVYKQCVFTEKGIIKQQFLTNLSYSFNEFGPQSLEVLSKLVPQLVSFQINNIPYTGGFCKTVLLGIIDKTTLNTNSIMKLRLSNINMSSKRFADSLCQIITNSKVLQLINFSWTSLPCESLDKISGCLLDRLLSLRSIDLSYNRLNFSNQNPKEFRHTQRFMQNLVEFLSKSILINHLKLSGMCYSREAIIQIVESVSKSPLLISLHLSDNDINTDYKYFNEVLNYFDLGEDDLHEANRSQLIKNQTFLCPKFGGYSNLNIKEFKSSLQKFLGFETKNTFNLTINNDKQNVNQQRQVLKDHILMGKQKKLIDNFKAVNNSQAREGLGRLNDGQFDQLVITRIVNYPELIYNQRIYNDAKKAYRFFQKDTAFKWRLSKKNECLLCEKNKYLIIFYERGHQAKNSGLIEITDKSFIQQLKNDYVKNYKTYQTLTPIISGSIVNKAYGMPNFTRNLKMMRASIFTLLCISGSILFISDKKQTQVTKSAIIRYLELDDQTVLEELDIAQMLSGWDKILDDKCNNNELTDVQQVNPPNFKKELSSKDLFIYSGFLPPGYHQLVIFDPEQSRAFCKDVIVGMNHKDFYPEYPILQDPVKHTKTVQNVWRQWRIDSEEDNNWSFNIDVKDQKFNPSMYIKNEDDVQKCIQILRSNFDMIKVYQLELIVGSSQYPQANWERIWTQLDWIHHNTAIPKEERLFQSQVELQFISATKYDTTKGLRSALQRQELLEFILRLAKAWTTTHFSAKTFTSDYIQHFIDLYIKPICDKSTILEIRNQMRKHQRLNELLFDNMKALQELFNEHKHPRQGYTLQSAMAFFFKFPEVKSKLSHVDIEKAFVFCQMTVLNEQDSLKKYHYLVFVEFLDMFCRIASAIYLYQDTMEYKVYHFLEIVFNHYYQSGNWSEETHLLFDINYDVDINEIL